MSARPEAKPLIRRGSRSSRAPQPESSPLSLKIESPHGAGRARGRRGRLPDLSPQPARAPADMNANVAVLDPVAELNPPCADELRRINESLQARERLLTASARASRLLLEAPDVRAAIPGVLGLIGAAARVDRVNLMQTRTGPRGERLLAVVSEWTGEHGRLAPPQPLAPT